MALPPNNVNLANPGNINDEQFYADMRTDIESVSAYINKLIKDQKKSGQEAKNLRDIYRNVSLELALINRLAAKYNEGLIKDSQIQNAIERSRSVQRELEQKYQQELGKQKNKQNKQLLTSIDLALQVNAEETKQLAKLKEANKLLKGKVGIFDSILQGAKKIPVIGDLLDIDDARRKMRDLAKEGKSSFTIIKAGFKEAMSTVGDKVSLSIIFAEAFKYANAADKEVTNIAKTLVKSKDAAWAIRNGFADVSRTTRDSFVNTKNIVEAAGGLTKQLGFAKLLSKDLLVEFIDVTKKMGLSEEAAGALAKLSIVTGKSFHTAKVEALGQAQAISSAYGIQLNNRDILETIGKLSGQILANFRGDSGALAKAVATAKALGTELSVVKDQAMYLLDFESSIESELKAELLTGQTLNLERARAAALQGDYLTVMKELNNQNVTWTKFSHMNVLQQKSLAESLGLSSDQLSDQLIKQEFLGKSKSEILALGGEQVAQQLEQVTIQDRFNAGMDKLKAIVGDMVAGPFGQLLDALVTILELAGTILAPFIQLYRLFSMIGEKIDWLAQKLGIVGKLLKGLAGIAIIYAAYKAFASLAAIPFFGAALGAVAAAGIVSAGFGLLASKATAMNDGFIDPKKDTVISGPAGTFKTHPDDKIMVGTDIDENTGKAQKSSPSIDLSPLIAAINSVKASIDRLYAKESTVYMDSKKVGTALVQGSYKVA